MFRTARRIAVLAIVAALVPAASGSAYGGGAGSGKVTVHDLHFGASSSVDIRFENLAATSSWSDGRTTLYTYELDGVVVAEGTDVEALMKTGAGTLTLAGAGATAAEEIHIFSWSQVATTRATADETPDGSYDVVIASPTDPTQIGLLLPAVQKVREAA